MTREETIQRVRSCGLAPVVRARSAESAMSIVEALIAGGVDIVEITMTVPGALGVMEKVAAAFGDKVVVGAGTVLDSETARAAILAGAEFIVSPGSNDAVIAAARRYAKMVCPGALTPTEVLHAWEAGADIVKIFPCGEVGGAKYIKSLKGPLPQIEMIPTGGVNLNTAADFIAAGCAALGVGTALIDAQAVAAGDYGVITDRAKQFLSIIRDARKR